MTRPPGGTDRGADSAALLRPPLPGPQSGQVSPAGRSIGSPKTPASKIRQVWYGVSTIGRALGYLAEFIGLVGLTLGIVMQLINLVMRNIGQTSAVPLWFNDASTVALVGGAFIYCAATDRHIGFGGLVDFIKNKRARAGINTITRIVVVACLVALTYSGIETVKQQMEVGGNYSDDLHIPLSLFYAIAPFTFGMCAIRWLTVRGSSKSEVDYAEWENDDDEDDPEMSLHEATFADGDALSDRGSGSAVMTQAVSAPENHP